MRVRVRSVGVRPHIRKGIPALAGYSDLTVKESAGKTTIVVYGVFPRPDWLVGRLPRPCGRFGCSVRVRLKCASGCFCIFFLEIAHTCSLCGLITLNGTILFIN